MNNEWVKQFEKPQITGNALLDLHPFVKLNMMAVLCILNFVLKSIGFSFALFVLSYLAAILAGKLRSFHKLYFKVILIFGLCWFIFKAMFVEGEHVLFRFAGICISTESIHSGISSSLLIVGFCGMFLVFFQLTPMSELMLAFENVGLSRTVSYVMLSTFQSVADLSANSKVIQESQKARGIETEGNLFTRVKAYIPILGPLVLNAVASTEEKTIAMEARAFSVTGKPTHLRQLPPIKAGQIVLVILTELLLVAGIVLRLQGGI